MIAVDLSKQECNGPEAQKRQICPVHPKGAILNPLTFGELAGVQDSIWIEHNGMMYQLRNTKQGKLVLTK